MVMGFFTGPGIIVSKPLTFDNCCGDCRRHDVCPLAIALFVDGSNVRTWFPEDALCSCLLAQTLSLSHDIVWSC